MGLDHPTIGIIGGNGRMGSWLARLLEGRGLHVLRAGRRTSLSPAELASRCEVVVVSVPIAATLGVIKEIGPLVAEDGLLMDLASVKKGPLEAMLRYSRAQVLGLHPLFGPDMESPAGLKVALCPGRGKEGEAWMRAILMQEGFRVITVDHERHDRLMGIIQGVNHFSTLALALCIARSGLRPEDLAIFATPAFQNRLERIRTILDQPLDLFASLLMDNPGAVDFTALYLDCVKQLAQITAEGNKGAFADLMGSVLEKLGGNPKNLVA